MLICRLFVEERVGERVPHRPSTELVTRIVLLEEIYDFEQLESFALRIIHPHEDIATIPSYCKN